MFNHHEGISHNISLMYLYKPPLLKGWTKSSHFTIRSQTKNLCIRLNIYIHHLLNHMLGQCKRNHKIILYFKLTVNESIKDQDLFSIYSVLLIYFN